VQITGASSSRSTATLNYSQFLTDASHRFVKTVDLAPVAGGMSSGTLTTGTSYRVVIPPQAGQLLLTDLQSSGVQITGANLGRCSSTRK
jgi:hypothetical protein